MALPVNINIMDVDAFIKENNVKAVTSMFIKETSTNVFHSSGLFSEEIFGQIGSPERLISFGYIELKTKILHPIIYNNICRLKAIYEDIMASKVYAIFDNDDKDFVKVEEGQPGAKTGYKFFIDNLPKVKFKVNDSLLRTDKINVIEKYRSSMFITKCLVMPAGIRDMHIEDGKPEKNSINSLYTSLIGYASAMSTELGESDIFDAIRFSIQRKVSEIYDFIFEMIDGKYGFFQRKYGSRNLALGTRNVISPASMAAVSPNSPQFLKSDEVKLPLFQAAKMYLPLCIYNMKLMFFGDVFSQSSDQVSLIDKKTFKMLYQPVDEEEKNKFLSTEGLEKIIDLYRDREFRFKPVEVYNDDGEAFYIYMVYDLEDEVIVIRSVSSLIEGLKTMGKAFNPDRLRPITYAELIYISTFVAAKDKYATVTRYPAIGEGSTVPCKAHITSTTPSRAVKYIQLERGMDSFIFPEYPVLHASSIDSTVLHPSILGGLGADFDGDTVSVNGVLTKEANEEIGNYLDSIERYVHTNGSLVYSKTDLISLTLFNMSREPSVPVRK